MARERVYTVVVIALALAVVTATPAGAADVAAPGLDVGSEHTTDSDFSGATLTNMSVTGSGTAANVTLDSRASIVDDFEDGDETPTSAAWGDWQSLTVQTTDAINGTGAANLSVGTDEEATYTETRSSEIHPDWIQLSTRINGSVGSNYGLQFAGASNDNIADIQFSSNGDIFINGEAQGSWEIYTDYRIRISDIDYSNNHADVSIHEIGSGDEVASATDTSTGDSLTGYQKITWHLDDSSFFGSDNGILVTIDDIDDEWQIGGTTDSGRYIGENHTIESAEQSWANISLENASATLDWQANDGTGWTTVDSTTVAQSGNYTAALSGGYQNWRLNATVQNDAGETSAVLHDEGALFSASAPAFDAGTATPTGIQSTEPTQLSIDVADADFGLSQSDDVDVDFELKEPADGSFSSVGSDTLTGNGTASTSVSVTEGGQIEWRATATDEYGESTASQTFEFEMPSTISIYNETDTAELVDDVNATIRFYANTTAESPLTVTRTTDNGTISMEGLPVTEPMIVTAEAPGYLSRRIFIESVFETSNIYLLNETEQHTQTIFELQDYTGAYPQGATVLEIQRVLNGSWQTVAGDYFGANNQFPAQLAFNIRHRLIIRNADTGESRILGTYTPIASASETMIISPDEPVPEPDEPPGIDVRPGARQLPTRDDVSVNTTVERGEAPLANYSVSLTHVNESGNTTLATLDGVNSSGETLRGMLDLSGVSDGEVVVVASVTTGTGTVVVERVRYDLRKVYDDTHTLIDGLNGLVSLAGSTAGTFTAFLAFVMTIVGTAAVATQFRLSSEMVGLIGVGWVATFAVIGWVNYDLLFAVLVAWAALSYLGRVY